MLAQTATGVADALERLGGDGGFRGQARRRPRADPPRRRRRRRSTPAASTTSPPGCPRSSRRRWRCRCTTLDRRRRGDRAAPGRPAAPVPGHRVAVRPQRRPAARTAQPLSVFFFDVLHVDGDDLLDAPDRPSGSRRSTRSCPPTQRVDRLVTADADAAQAFLDAHARRRPRGRDGQVARPRRTRPAAAAPAG